METANTPQPCIGCGRPTLWKTGRLGAPLCGRRSCGSGDRATEMIFAWGQKERERLDAAIIARADHLRAQEGKK
jgi:hypothetical protein